MPTVGCVHPTVASFAIDVHPKRNERKVSAPAEKRFDAERLR
jgi:hypothetical protein